MHKDLQALTTRRKTFGNLAVADLRGLARRRELLKLSSGREAALAGVQAGGVVTNDMTRHWRGGLGLCECGLAKQTLEHV